MASSKFENEAEKNFPDFLEQDSITRSHLSLELYKKLYPRVTPLGVTLDHCIQIACEQVRKEKITGLLAGDEHCYEEFKELFDLVIDERHGGFGPDQKHSPRDLDAEVLAIDGVLDERYVKSCRIRTARNLKGVRLAPCISRGERRLVEQVFTDILSKLQGALQGKYYPLAEISREGQKLLRENHFLFQEPVSHIIVNSGARRDWPTNRGIWYNEAKSFLTWINEEDHCRVISMQKGGDMKAVFTRFCFGLQKIEKCVIESGHRFQWNERLGFLGSCPANIGTGLRCSVHVQLKQLGKHLDFHKVCQSLGLSQRGTGGEGSGIVDDVYDISNTARVGQSERQLVQTVIDGVTKLIEMEKSLETSAHLRHNLPIG